MVNTGPFMTVTVHDSVNTTTILTLDFPLNFNALDIFTPQEMIHTTHNENDSTKQPMKTSAKKKLFFGHDTAFFVLLIFPNRSLVNSE